MGAPPLSWSVTAVVLAGGLGTRIRDLVPDRPKPMALVAGEPFLEWVLRYLAGFPVKQIIVSAGYLSKVIEDYISQRPLGRQRVTCEVEAVPLGTAGGLLHAVKAANHRPSAWLVINGDSLALADLNELMAFLDDSTCDGAVLGVNVPDAARYGTLVVDGAHRLIGFEEKRPGAGVINAGVYLFRDRLLKLVPKSYPMSLERDLFPELIGQGRNLQVVVTEAPFLDIGTPDSLRSADEFIRSNRQRFATGVES